MMNITLPTINSYRNMNKLPMMSWNNTLESTATQWVAICPKVSTTTYRMIHYTQGEAAVYLPKVVQNAINVWVNEQIANKQLAWVGTQQVGCSIFFCPNMFMAFGCVYSPPYM
jgi:hypothetical protein